MSSRWTTFMRSQLKLLSCATHGYVMLDAIHKIFLESIHSGNKVLFLPPNIYHLGSLIAWPWNYLASSPGTLSVQFLAVFLVNNSYLQRNKSLSSLIKKHFCSWLTCYGMASSVQHRHVFQTGQGQVNDCPWPCLSPVTCPIRVLVQNGFFNLKRHNEQSLQKKYELVQMAEKNPKLGTRKLDEYFNISKTQPCTILNNSFHSQKLWG